MRLPPIPIQSRSGLPRHPLIVGGDVGSMTRAPMRRGAVVCCLENRVVDRGEPARAVLVVIVSWNGVPTNSVSSRA